MENSRRWIRCIEAYREARASRSRSYSTMLGGAERFIERRKEEHRRRPPSINVFDALGHIYREGGTHSAMLGHLFDPNATHGQGALFLNRFLSLCKAQRISTVWT